MTLFDTGERTSTRLKTYKESDFAYLNQSGRPSVVALRPLLEDWFDHVRHEDQSDLRSRFRSSDDNQHVSAFFELYIHELLKKLGYDVNSHPILKGVRTHPDFLARCAAGCEFYVEVTVAGIPTRADQGADARIAQVYDALDQMDSPDFFLHLSVQGIPSTPPPGAKLRSDLSKWLRTLKVSEIAMAGQSGLFEGVPNFAGTMMVGK